jgi:hypothetical protein
MEIINNPFVDKNNKQIKLEQIDLYKKVRKTWGIKPTTKVEKSKKKYNRKLSKKEIRETLKREDF